MENSHKQDYYLALLSLIGKNGNREKMEFSLFEAVHTFVRRTMDVAYHFDAEVIYELAKANKSYLERYNIPPEQVPLTDSEVLNEKARDMYTLREGQTKGVYILPPAMKLSPIDWGVFD